MKFFENVDAASIQLHLFSAFFGHAEKPRTGGSATVSSIDSVSVLRVEYFRELIRPRIIKKSQSLGQKRSCPRDHVMTHKSNPDANSFRLLIFKSMVAVSNRGIGWITPIATARRQRVLAPLAQEEPAIGFVT